MTSSAGATYSITGAGAAQDEDGAESQEWAYQVGSSSELGEAEKDWS